MNVRVRLFAVARQLAGREEATVELPAGATIGQLRQSLVAQIPELAGIAYQCLFAVGTNYVGDQTPLDATSDVACIPPVSGG